MEISLCGFYGHNNFGDSLMWQELIVFLSQLSGDPVSVYSDKTGCESICYQDNFNFGADLVAVGGGGIITPNFWFFKERIAKRLKTTSKLGLINVNLTSESIPVLREIKDRLSFAIVRDFTSLELLNRELGYGTKCLTLMAPDISFLKPKLEINESNKYVSICLNAYVLNNYFSSDLRKRIYAEKFLIELSSFLIWLKSFGHKIQLVPSQVDREVNDNRISALVDGMIGGADNWIYDNKNIEEHLIHSKLIVSMRYHATLTAIKYAIPFIDISHHSKNKNFLLENKLESLSVDYWTSSLDILKETANKAKYYPTLGQISEYYSVSSIEKWGQIKHTLS